MTSEVSQNKAPLLAVALVFTVFSLVLAYFGGAQQGAVGFRSIEFTIASLFSKKNLQVAMYELGKSDAKISVAVGLVSLVFAFVVLFAMSFVGSSPAGTSPLARFRRTRVDRKEPAA